MKRLLIFLLCFHLAIGPLGAEIFWVTQNGAGLANGTSLANAWSATNFNAVGGSSIWGVGAGKISAADTANLSGTFTSRLTVGGSGTNGSPIILKGDGALSGSGTAVQWTGTTILVGIEGGAQDYIWLIGNEIRHTSTANAYAAITWAGAVGWLVEDNYIHNTYLNGIASNTGTNANNIVRHNWFNDIGAIDLGNGGGGNPDVADLYGNAHLFEYNTVNLSMDRTRPFGTGIVIRNNYFGATDSAIYSNSHQYPSHTDGLQSFQGGPALIQILYERNYDTDNADTVYTGGNNGSNAHMLLIQDSSGVAGFTWMIQRFNLTIRAGGSGFNYTNMSHVYTYNETYANIGNTLLNTQGILGAWTFGGTSPATSDVADLRNTTTVYATRLNEAGGLFQFRPTNFTSGSNHTFTPSGVTNAQLPTGASPANLSSSPTSTPPLFTSANGTTLNDYSLQSGSPLRGTGSSYLTAVGAGTTSTALTVTNGQWLYDGRTASGWPGTDADLIKVGSNGYQRVVSVVGNVVTLTTAISWSNGDTVLVKGNEDVGALPYSYSTNSQTISIVNTTLASGANTLTATAGLTDAARGVEWLVDAIPIGIVYDSPYSQSYTSDGGTHTVEARCLSMWANTSPTISDIKALSASASNGSGVGGTVTVGGTVKVN